MPCLMEAIGWILRAERYFSFYRLSEEDRLEAAVVALEGDPLLWYQWEHRRRPIKSWEDLKSLLLRQFRSTRVGSLYEQWLAVKQETSVGEYQRAFIETLAPLKYVPEEVAMGHFINGLKNDIRAEVRVMSPINLDRAMDLAIRIEAKVSPPPKIPIVKSTQSNTSPNLRTASISLTPNFTNSSNKNHGGIANSKPIKGIRRLSERELQEKKKRKGRVSDVTRSGRWGIYATNVSSA